MTNGLLTRLGRRFDNFWERYLFYYSDTKACLRGNTEFGQDSEAGVNIQPILGGLRTVWTLGKLDSRSPMTPIRS